MNWYKIGSYIWTGCGAAWLVLGVTSGVLSCYVVGLGCIAVSAVFNDMGNQS